MSRQLKKKDIQHYLDSMWEKRKLGYVATTGEIRHSTLFGLHVWREKTGLCRDNWKKRDSTLFGLVIRRWETRLSCDAWRKKKALNIIWTHHEKEEPQPSIPRPLFVRHYTLQRARPLDGLLCPPPSGLTLSETCILSYSLYPRSVGASPSALIRIAGTCMANLLSMIYNWIVK